MFYSIIILLSFILFFISSALYECILYSFLLSNFIITAFVYSKSEYSSMIRLALHYFKVSNVVINPIPLPPADLWVVILFKPRLDNVSISNSIPVS